MSIKHFTSTTELQSTVARINERIRQQGGTVPFTVMVVWDPVLERKVNPAVPITMYTSYVYQEPASNSGRRGNTIWTGFSYDQDHKSFGWNGPLHEEQIFELLGTPLAVA